MRVRTLKFTEGFLLILMDAVRRGETYRVEGLPEDARPFDPTAPALVALVESDTFDDVPDGCEPPNLDVTFFAQDDPDV